MTTPFLKQLFPSKKEKQRCGNARPTRVPDGFTFSFIKKQWDTIGGDIFLAIKEFEKTGKIDRGSNSSFIILVPKITDPNTLDDFRPVSLTGCLYKIISKVLAKRASIIVNGSTTKELSLEKGIQQGDPFSLFLFILPAEGLNIALEEATNHCIFKSISLPNNGPTVSHLQYADDAIFLGEWPIQNVKNLIRILCCYELASILKVSITKRKLFGLGINNLEIELLSRSIQCFIGNLPFVYLGMHVGATISRISQWIGLIAKFQAKLSKWKPSMLLFVSRLTLCKAVLGSLGTFLFSLDNAPIKVLNNLEKIRRCFFWGGSSEKSKLAWIGWEKVLLKQENGGLSICSLKAYNLALLVK
uniref:Reverse transcriptase domain-containing protein n=1 Tax=Lactuca sativa TaxID=4236 RepID=A0A9R1XE03_LACSA|nr:hypothetical protein LSAT_V11C500258210 [Lactuca sativa]